MRSEAESKDDPGFLSMQLQGILFQALVLPSLAMRDGSYFEFWVYILTSRNGTLYVGVTGYLHSRIMQHKIDSIESFTQKYQVHRLVYYESYQYVQSAIRREKQLKGWRRDTQVRIRARASAGPEEFRVEFRL